MVEKEIVLPVERERAWELMTEEPEEWLADEVELEPEPGAPLRATWDDGEERTGVVEEVEPGRRLRFRWDDDRHRHPLPRGVAARRGPRRDPRPRARDPARARRGPRLDRPRHPHHRARPGEHAARGVTGPSKLDLASSLRGTRTTDPDAVFAALADPTRREVIGRLAREPLSASAPGGRAPDLPPGGREAPRRARPRRPRRRPPRGPRAPVPPRPRAAGRRDGVDGLRGRALGRAPRATGRARPARALGGRWRARCATFPLTREELAPRRAFHHMRGIGAGRRRRADPGPYPAAVDMTRRSLS